MKILFRHFPVIVGSPFVIINTVFIAICFFHPILLLPITLHNLGCCINMYFVYMATKFKPKYVTIDSSTVYMISD